MNHLLTEIHACGKLLITGEYLILRGARGLALPTSRGQQLKVSQTLAEGLVWVGIDAQGNPWLECSFDKELDISSSSDKAVSLKLQLILREAKRMNARFLSAEHGFHVETRLEFPRDWGLGSSSTLIYTIARWADVDALELSEHTLGGSGYDVATAMHDSAITYERGSDGIVNKKVSFNPDYKDQLFFVHLGRKKDSSKEVADFKFKKVSEEDIKRISMITDEVLKGIDLKTFESLMEAHNQILERILERSSASTVFADYTSGITKYLGGWGGDFLLATGSSSDMDYFRSKGLTTILSYTEMIKK